MNDKILIVASNYYKITDNLIKVQRAKFLNEKKFDYDVIYSPGCFEIPFLINKNIDNYKGFYFFRLCY